MAISRAAMLAAAAVAMLAVSALADPVVVTDSGPVRGIEDDIHRAFYGIPFGKPPVGDLRWTSPQKPDSWTEVRDATTPGNMCPGTIQAVFDLVPRVTISEDCLYLNVYTPPPSRLTRKLPVMVWFYGGAYILGDGHELGAYDGSYIVSTRDVIIVAGNYRLGPFGFLVTESLRGNYGVEDQRFVLDWVQRNIANFGGDPNNVLIYGESAGAMSVGFHLASPPSHGLFHKAIMQSNAFGLRFKPREMAVEVGAELAEVLGCAADDLPCMRNATMEEVAWKRRWVFPRNGWELLLADLLIWGPTVDEYNLPENALDAFLKGNTADVPLMWGVNRDEVGVFQDLIDMGVLLMNRIIGTDFEITMRPEVYEGFVRAIFRTQADRVLEVYPVVGEENYDQFSHLVTDFVFRCPSLHASEVYSATKESPVYAYHFTHTPDLFPRLANVSRCFNQMACHALELPYTWHMEDLVGIPLSRFFTPEEEAMSQELIDYWTNFAAGNINGHNPPVHWPIFNATTSGQLEINLQIRARQWDIPECDLWAELGYNY